MWLSYVMIVGLTCSDERTMGDGRTMTGHQPEGASSFLLYNLNDVTIIWMLLEMRPSVIREIYFVMKVI